MENTDKQKSRVHELLLEEDKKKSSVKDGKSTNTVVRVCHICGKGFSSGKGLGGHLRSHYQKARNELNLSKISKSKKRNEDPDEFSSSKRRKVKKIDDAVEENLHTCRLCPKTFLSEKSLFGHMRWHPDRDWRGIQPPADWIYNGRPSSSNSPLSSLSDADQPLNIADKIEATVVVNEQKVAVDLTQGLVGWKVTARRGRNAFTRSSDDLEDDPQLKDAAEAIVLMSSGAFSETENASEINQCSAEIGKNKKIELDDVDGAGVIVLGESISKIHCDLEGTKLIKKRKVARLCGLGSSGEANKQQNNTGQVFKSGDRPFEAYHAVGEADEDMSNHSKIKYVDFSMKLEACSSHKNYRLLDLNEPPPLENGDGKGSKLC